MHTENSGVSRLLQLTDGDFCSLCVGSRHSSRTGEGRRLLMVDRMVETERFNVSLLCPCLGVLKERDLKLGQRPSSSTGASSAVAGK